MLGVSLVGVILMVVSFALYQPAVNVQGLCGERFFSASATNEKGASTDEMSGPK